MLAHLQVHTTVGETLSPPYFWQMKDGQYDGQPMTAIEQLLHSG